MTTIIAGKLKGKRLQVPQHGTRPTSSRVREAIFSHLTHYDVLAGATVLDLFAGSGALGIEAVSRGAYRAVLVDSARSALQALRANIRLDRSHLQVRASDALSSAAISGSTWDIVFIDPPYDLAGEQIEQLLAALTPQLGSDPTIVVERDSRNALITPPPGLRIYETKNYGETVVHYLTRTDTNPATQQEDTDA